MAQAADDSTMLAGADHEITLVFWYKQVSTGTGSNSCQILARPNEFEILWISGGNQVLVGIWDSIHSNFDFLGNPLGITDGNWHQVVITKTTGSQSTVTAYVDGSQVWQATMSGLTSNPNGAASNHLNIGNGTGLSFDIDEIAYFTDTGGGTALLGSTDVSTLWGGGTAPLFWTSANGWQVCGFSGAGAHLFGSLGVGA